MDAEYVRDLSRLASEARPNRYYTQLKDKLDMIVKAGAAGRSFLVRRVPLEGRKRLKNAAGGYRRQYSKAGFTFEVRKLPGEEAVGLCTVWQPPTPHPSA